MYASGLTVVKHFGHRGLVLLNQIAIFCPANPKKTEKARTIKVPKQNAISQDPKTIALNQFTEG